METKRPALLLFFFVLACLLFGSFATRTLKAMEISGGGDDVSTTQPSNGNRDDNRPTQPATDNGDDNDDDCDTNSTGDGHGQHGRRDDPYCGGRFGAPFCLQSNHQEALSISCMSTVFAIASVVMFGIA